MRGTIRESCSSFLLYLFFQKKVWLLKKFEFLNKNTLPTRHKVPNKYKEKKSIVNFLYYICTLKKKKK